LHAERKKGQGSIGTLYSKKNINVESNVFKKRFPPIETVRNRIEMMKSTYNNSPNQGSFIATEQTTEKEGASPSSNMGSTM